MEDRIINNEMGSTFLHKTLRAIKNLSISKKIIAGFSLPILLMTIVSSFVYNSTNSLVDTAQWVQHTQKVISKGHLLEKLIVDMETGERGFLITGKDEFLQPFVASKKQWSIEIAETKKLVNDNPIQVENLNNIDIQAKQWIERAATPEIAQRRKVRSDSISLDHIEEILQKKIGKNILDKIREIVSGLDKVFVKAESQLGSNLLVTILKDIVDQEAGERGFLITGEDEFLEPYYQGHKNFNLHISELKSLVLNSPSPELVSKLIAEAETLAASWHKEAAVPEINIRRQQIIEAKQLRDTDAKKAKEVLTKSESMRATDADAERAQKAKVLLATSASIANEKKLNQQEQLLSKGTGKGVLDDLRRVLDELNTIYINSKNENAQIVVLSIAKSIVDQETGQRGFLLTGKEQFLQPFNQGGIDFEYNINALKKINNGAYNKIETLSRIESIEDELNDWQQYAAKIEISTRREINRTGLSPMELLQKTVTTELDIVSSKKILFEQIKRRFITSNLIKGSEIILSLEKNISNQMSQFLQYMINGNDDHLSSFRQGQDTTNKLFVDLSVLVEKTYTRKDLDMMRSDINELISSIQKWYLSDIETAINKRINFEQSRSFSLTQIQNILKKGQGKHILDQSRLLLDEINEDFLKARNIEGSKLTLQIGKSLVDQETGQLGYIITGDETFLEPYEYGSKNLHRSVSALMNVAYQAFDINGTQQQINDIETRIESWLSKAAEPEIELRRQVNLGNELILSLEKTLIIGTGKGVLDDIRFRQDELSNTFSIAKNTTAQRLVISISKDIVDMETSQRGYLITGKPEFLQPYNRGRKSLKKHFTELRSLVGASYNTYSMIAKINKLRVLADQWKKLAGEPEINLRRELNESSATMKDVTRLIESETGKKIIDAIKRDIKDFIEIENNLIVRRTSESESAASTSLFQIVFGTLGSIIIAFTVATYLLRTILNSLKYLGDGTNRVAEGDYATYIDIQSDDQIGKLAGSFNAMTHQLEATRSAIDSEIAERKKTETELIKAKEAAEAAVVSKGQFLATMSHEIRTPMNGVLGMLGLLMKSELSEEQSKKVNMAHSSAQSLLTIINDILDFSKVDAGKIELEILDFDLRNLLGEFSETMAIKAQDKGLEIILNIIEIEHSMVKGDPSRIRQILTNIVGNAIKFTNSGEIVIRASLKSNEDDGLTLHCSIQDTGIGIPDDKLEGLFDAFSQVDASTTRKYGGTGLGLSIVKKLCELMDGSIKATNPTDGGSCFEFSVKLENSDMSRNVVPQINMKALNLLVVDNSETNRRVLCQQLEHWGAKVHEAVDGYAALALLQQRIDADMPLFEVAFIDAGLPVMDGSQLAKKIKSNVSFNPMKLVMMTSMAHRGDAQYFSKLGFSAYFPRPATTSDLFDALSVIVEDAEALKNASPLVTHHYVKSLDHEHERTQSEVELGIVSSNNHAPSWPDDTRLLLVEDNQINQEVIKFMLDDLDLSADMVSDGEEALNMLIMSPDTNPYTLILMDCQMPIMDGYTTTQNIRRGTATGRYKTIPIVALTANAMKGDKKKCLDAGMSDYLSKPIEPSALESMLVKWLLEEKLSSTEDVVATGDITEISPPSAQQENNLDETLVWDKDEALKRIGGKEDRLNRLIKITTADISELMEKLQQAVVTKSQEEVRLHSHSIKGIAANLSVLRLAKEAGKLEAAAKAGELTRFHELTSAVNREYQAFTEQLDLHQETQVSKASDV